MLVNGVCGYKRFNKFWVTLGRWSRPSGSWDNPQTTQIVVDFYIHKIDYYQRNGKPISYAPDSVSAVVTTISSSWIWVWRRKLTLHQDWRSTTRKLEREGGRAKICNKCAWSIISSGAILYLLLKFIHSFILDTFLHQLNQSW